jgi:hypothetical protein
MYVYTRTHALSHTHSLFLSLSRSLSLSLSLSHTHTHTRTQRYYGIYGNTVNMGARMAQHAEHGTVCVDSDLAAFIRASEDSLLQGFVLASLGHVQVKGKGLVEVFRMVREEQAAAQCPQGQDAAEAPHGQDAHSADAGVGVLAASPGRLARRHSVHSTLDLGEFDQLRGEAERCKGGGDADANCGALVAEGNDGPAGEAAKANIAKWSQQFENADVERRFVEGQADADRLGLTAGLLLNALTVAWQFLNVVVPANASYFQGHGVKVGVVGVVVYPKP